MRLSVLAILSIRLIGPMVFCSGADTLTIAWSDLAKVVGDRPVAVGLNHTTEVHGTVVRQDEPAVMIAVDRAKPSNACAHGKATRFGRSAITRFTVTKEPTRVGGRMLGMLGGYFVGAELGVLAGGGEQDPRTAIGMIGGLVGGYYVGRSRDKETIETRFLDTGAQSDPPKPQARTLPHYLRDNFELPVEHTWNFAPPPPVPAR